MSETQKQKDYARKPLQFMVGWGLPIIVLFSVNFLEGVFPTAVIILMIAGSFAWMGVGCVLNAMRCRRLHCYISGPAMLIGAAAVLLVGFNMVDFGPVRVMHISNATLALVALSFVPEFLFGAYVNKPRNVDDEHMG